MFYEIKNNTTFTNPTVIKDNVSHKGKTYQLISVKTEGNRFLKTVGALFATLFSFGTALASQKIRNLWQAGLLGRVKYYRPSEEDQRTEPPQKKTPPDDTTSSSSSTSLSEEGWTSSSSSTEEETPVDKMSSLREQLMQAANTSMAAPLAPLEVQLLDEDKDLLTKIFLGNTSDEDKDKFTLIEAHTQTVILLKSQPGLVFKRPKERSEQSEDSIKKQVNIYNDAMKVVKENGLNLLHIPRCTASKVGRHHFLVQEKLEIKGDLYFQKGLYNYGFENEKLNPIMKESFRQLVKFICLTKFADVKYDNIPFLMDRAGIGLIDLDTNSRGAGTGLFLGRREKLRDGLLSYCPNIEFYEELIEIAKETLKEDPEKDRLMRDIQLSEQSVKERIQKRQDKRNKVKQFLEQHKITTSTQPIDLKNVTLHSDPKLSELQTKILNIVNKKLEQSEQIDLVRARRIRIYDVEIGSFEPESLKEAMQHLVNLGVISHFKYRENFNELTIGC